MSNKFTPGSWRAAARPFDSVAGSLPGRIQSVVASSTDANAIGSASGISLFDTAVTGVLGGLAQVMNELGADLSDGLNSEATVLDDIAKTYAKTEDNNTLPPNYFQG